MEQTGALARPAGGPSRVQTGPEEGVTGSERKRKETGQQEGMQAWLGTTVIMPEVCDRGHCPPGHSGYCPAWRVVPRAQRDIRFKRTPCQEFHELLAL